MLRYANQRRVPVVPFGGGSGVGGGVLPDGGTIVVDLRRMNQHPRAQRDGAAGARAGRHVRPSLRGRAAGARLLDGSLAAVGRTLHRRRLGRDARRRPVLDALRLDRGHAARPRGGAGRRSRGARQGDAAALRRPRSRATSSSAPKAPPASSPRRRSRSSRCPRARRMMCFAFPDFDSGLEAIRHIVRAGWRPPVTAALRRHGDRPPLRPVAAGRSLLSALGLGRTGQPRRGRGRGLHRRLHRARRRTDRRRAGAALAGRAQQRSVADVVRRARLRARHHRGRGGVGPHPRPLRRGRRRRCGRSRT